MAQTKYFKTRKRKHPCDQSRGSKTFNSIGDSVEARNLIVSEPLLEWIINSLNEDKSRRQMRRRKINQCTWPTTKRCSLNTLPFLNIVKSENDLEE